MDEERLIISRVDPEAFLVKDESLKDINAPFYVWLRDNGFKHAWHKGHYDVCDWVFVNITHKLFAYGMPGIKVVNAIGNHAITIEEFKTIFEIYAKYCGLDLMVFSHEEAERLKAQEEKTKEAHRRLCETITFEDFESEVTDGFFRRVERTPEAEAYLKSEEAQTLMHNNFVGYSDPDYPYGGCEPEATAGCLSLMYE